MSFPSEHGTLGGDMHDRTDLAIGTLAYIFYHMADAAHHDLFSLPLDSVTNTSDAAFQAFRQKVPETTITAEDLVRWGQRVKQQGTPRHTQSTSIQLGRYMVTLPRPDQLSKDWRSFDHIYPKGQNPTNEAQFAKWTTNRLNSCAFEAAVLSARRACAGLQQGDLMSLLKLRRMDTFQRVFYKCITLDVAKAQREDLENLINLLMQKADPHFRTGYTYGGQVDVNEILSLALTPYNSFTYYVSEMHTCCDPDRMRVDWDAKRYLLRVVHNIDLVGVEKSRYVGLTLEQAINHAWFRSLSLDESNLLETGDPATLRTRCEAGVHCKQLITKHTVLLTSLGGWFVLGLSGGIALDKPTLDERRPFDDKVIRTMDRQGRVEEVLMRVKIAIFCVNGNHFITRMKGTPGHEEGILGHDGLKVPRLIPYKSFLQGIRTDVDRLVTLFMERVEDPLPSP